MEWAQLLEHVDVSPVTRELRLRRGCWPGIASDSWPHGFNIPVGHGWVAQTTARHSNERRSRRGGAGRGGAAQQGVAADEARILVGRRPRCPCLHLRRASQLNAGVGPGFTVG